MQIEAIALLTPDNLLHNRPQSGSTQLPKQRQLLALVVGG
jgi:hypothetical protein